MDVSEDAESRDDRAGFFSSARRFSLPLGPRIVPGGVEGYYIDMRVKARRPDWPAPWLPPRERQLHVDVCQWALGAFERHLAGQGDVWLAASLKAGEHLLACQEQGGHADGAFLHLFRYPHSLPLPPPWASAMAQGEAASLFVRLYGATGDARFADAALRSLLPMTALTEDGGTLALLGGQPFPEEYPTRPPSFVLNGGIFALWGFYDVATGLADDAARRAFDGHVGTLARNLHRWDLGYWSRYDLFPHPVPNPASSFYHVLHISQLEAMERLAPRQEISAIRARFVRYAASPWSTRRAFAHKALYRLIVPRNRLLAHRLPWTRRLSA